MSFFPDMTSLDICFHDLDSKPCEYRDGVSLLLVRSGPRPLLGVLYVLVTGHRTTAAERAQY